METGTSRDNYPFIIDIYFRPQTIVSDFAFFYRDFLFTLGLKVLTLPTIIVQEHG
jgi:hypothetical protein